MRTTINLTAADLSHIYRFIEEMDALIDADDGTCFACQHIDQLATVKEIVGYVAPDNEEDDYNAN